MKVNVFVVMPDLESVISDL